MVTARNDNIAAALGVIGMITATIMAFTIEPEAVDYLWFGWGGLIPLAGGSAWLAGRLCGCLFGRAGGSGWLSAALGAVLSTICGAMIAGTFVYPFLGTIFAPLVLLAEILVVPSLALSWSALMMSLHVWALKTKDF